MILDRNATVLVHGITGKQATFWTEQMRAYGTNVIGGVNPKRAGEHHLELPVYGSATEAMADRASGTAIDASVFFVPANGARAAVDDALTAGVELLVVLTEFIPVHDTMAMARSAREAGARIIGPNTAGIVTPGECFVGFMPAFNPAVFTPGSVGVVSRSGSLGTLVSLELTRNGIGQSAFIGVGGDPVSGTSSAEAVQALVDHDATEAIVLLGEIGGVKEEQAAEIVATSTKPVVAYLAGAHAPPGKKMGHAGAIVSGNTGTYASKRKALQEAGAVVVDAPWQVPAAVAETTTSAS